MEWWYYAGHAYDEEGIQYSFQFNIDRSGWSSGPEAQLIAYWTGIGNSGDGSYLFDSSYGFGVSEDPEFPQGLTVAVSNDNYEVSTQPLLGSAQTRISRTGGESPGAKGSEYRLISFGSTPQRYEVELNLLDERGMVMEWQSGYIGPDSASHFGNASFEFAQPRLRITSGRLELNGSVRNITRGMLWLDRQVVTPPPTSSEAAVRPDDINAAAAKHASMKSLYTGSWIGITLDDGLTFVCACFWQPPPKPHRFLQWQTGTLLGLPPMATYGNVYFNEEGRRVRNGGSYLRGFETGDPDDKVFDFDVNILQPDSPDKSPHWQSPTATYSTGWWIRIGPEGQRCGLPANLYLSAVVPGCENVLPSVAVRLNAFWEGAANVYADAALTRQIGHAFVEQMGFDGGSAS
jgi:hypothetical protein